MLHLHLTRLLRLVACWGLIGAGLELVTACSGNPGSEEAATVPPPTGHYEGPITYQGSELRVTMELREVSPGKLEAEIDFPQLPGLGFAATRTSYQAPQLRLEQASAGGGIGIQAVREGDFLRGVLTWDSLQADFVWARRGEAAPRGFREQALGSAQRLRLLLPDDTLPQHPALVLLATPATAAAAAQRATYLARHGVAAVVVPLPASAPDSVAGMEGAAALAAVRRQAGIDSSKVGYWGRATGGLAVAAAARQQPSPAFAVLEGVPVITREDGRPYQVFNQQRIPVLGLYAALDTAAQVPVSARRLRTALGQRQGTYVRVFPGATSDFLLPGRSRPDGQWQWPQPAAGYWPGLVQWLQQQ
ncbi:hypothetical protein [Hymenobacter sp. UYP22]|uniref:dienelactone hydrolase family protein n=1 Tax=Hymenobacter sp. UYP22 TaxID=3156348 RepID=UPI00339419C0